MHSNHIRILVKCSMCDSAGLRWGLRLCISNKLQGDAADLRTILWVPENRPHHGILGEWIQIFKQLRKIRTCKTTVVCGDRTCRRLGYSCLAVCSALLVNMQNLWKNSPETDLKRGSIINQLQANTAKRHHDTCLKLQINAYFYKLSIRQEKPCQETQTKRKRHAQQTIW